MNGHQWQFGLQFQHALLRQMVDDESFCALCVRHLQPHYFETPALGWIYDRIRDYQAKFARPPTPLVLVEQVRDVDAGVYGSHAAAVQAVITQAPAEGDYVRARVVEFVQRNIVVESHERIRHLYNIGAWDDAVEAWKRGVDEFQSVSLDRVDRSFFFEDFDARQKRRAADAAQLHTRTFSTGIHDLDTVLEGGLSRGELGIWVAYAKTGKSMMLQWHAYYAVRALRIPVLYVVLEGGREQTEDRFEAAFARTTKQAFAKGEVDGHRIRALQDEYREMKDLLVIRGFTKESTAWNATVADIYAELVDLRQRRGFRPKMIVVDYGDLLKARHRYDNPTHEQAAAFRDLKALCDRDDGYAIWTASQAQRPKAGVLDNSKHVVRSSQIADCYEKVRCADFIGSLNRSTEEAAQEKMRIFAELYRSNAAGKLIEVRTDYSHSKAVTQVLKAYEAPHVAQTEFDVGE